MSGTCVLKTCTTRNRAIHGFVPNDCLYTRSQTVLSKLADSALEQSDADEVSILLPTEDAQELYVAMVRGESENGCWVSASHCRGA